VISEETIVVIVSVTIVILERAFLELTPGARPEHSKGVDDRVPGGISATENPTIFEMIKGSNRSLGEGIIRKNGVRRGCTPPADTIFSGSYPLQVGELNGY
jgi:hypothetical protein